MKKKKRFTRRIHALTFETLSARRLLAADVAENIPTDTARGTDLPIIPIESEALIDGGSAEAIRGLDNLIGPYLGAAPDAGAHELGLGVAWTGPREFVDQLAFGLPSGWAVTDLTELNNYSDLNAPPDAPNARLLITLADPRAFIFVDFEMIAGADRWSRFEEILDGNPVEQVLVNPLEFRDGLGASLREHDGVSSLIGARVDYNGVLRIRGAVASESLQDVQDDFFTFVRSLYYAWDADADATPVAVHGVTAVGAPASPSSGDATVAGLLHGDVTLTSASIIWDLQGDDNQNAAATIQFRRQGTTDWRDALDLNRVVYSGNTKDTGEFRDLNRFAGSIFSLSPGTTYEVQVSLDDSDGGSVTQTTTLTTRSIPRVSGLASVTEVNNIDELNAATSQVVLLHAGDYGSWELTRGGIQGAPVLYKPFGDGAVNFDRITVKADYVWLDGLHVGTGGIHGHSKLPDVSQIEVAVTRTEVTGAFHTINAYGGDWFVADNILIGHDPPAGSFSGEGIEFQGRGHVAAFNDISKVGDGLSYGDGNIDIHHNRIHANTDDSIEPDYAWDNYRIWENFTWDGGNNGVSFQPMQGGPWYVIRNQITGTSYNPFKLRSVTGAPFVVGNTVIYRRAIQDVDRLFRSDGAFANNFIRVDGENGDNMLGYGTMPDPIEMRLWDYNRYDVPPENVFKMDGRQTLQDLRAVGVETNTIVLREFEVPLTANSDRGRLFTENAPNEIGGNILSNDTAPDRDTIRIVLVNGTGLGEQPTAGQYGELRLQPNGTYVYSLEVDHPAVTALLAREVLVDIFSYAITDGVDTSDSELTITITGGPPTSGGDHRPEAVSDEITINENQELVEINLLANDLDADGDELFVAAFPFTSGRFGTADVTLDGIFQYSLERDHPEVDAQNDGDVLFDYFQYIMSDGTTVDTGLITVSITGITDDLTRPFASNDLAMVTENGFPATAVGNVLTNDLAPDGESLIVSAVNGNPGGVGGITTGEFGSLELGMDGTYRYVLDEENPAVDALREDDFLVDAFSYTISDGRETDSATLSIQIDGVDDGSPPVAQDDERELREDSSVDRISGNVLSNDFDWAGQSLVIEKVNGSSANVGLSLPGTFGEYLVASDGHYEYRLDNENPRINALNDGEFLVEEIAYTVSNGERSSHGVLRIRIQGSTDTERLVGDSNGDGFFDSSDLILVFQAGEYEDDVAGNSTFAEGDWNGDGDFDSSDLVLAFQEGRYEVPLELDAKAVESIFARS